MMRSKLKLIIKDTRIIMIMSKETIEQNCFKADGVGVEAEG